MFFNANEPENNLNFKSSNYSGLEGYDIYLSLVVNVTGLDDLGRSITGDFVTYGGVLSVNDYDESEDGVSGVIQTFDPDTLQSLDGDILFNGKDTLFRAVFQNASLMSYGIHRIEPSLNAGDGIREFSNVEPSEPNNILKPLTGETALSFNKVGSQLTTECLIDGNLIEENTAYKLSARVGVTAPPLPFIFTVQSDNSGTSNNDQFTFPQRLGTSPNYTMTVLDSAAK